MRQNDHRRTRHTDTESGATKEMIEGIADATIILDGGYKTLDRAEIIEILTESL